jgi:hypothetical protein
MGRPKGSPNNGPICGAKTRSGNQCKQPAGYRTTHFGEGRCYFHGGATPLRTGTSTSLKDPKSILRGLGIEGVLSEVGIIPQVYDLSNDSPVVNADIQSHQRRANLILNAIETALTTKPGPDGKPIPLTIEEFSKEIERNPYLMELLRIWTDQGSKIEANAARIRALDAVFTLEDVVRLSQKFTRVIAKYVQPEQRDAVLAELRSATDSTAQTTEARIKLTSAVDEHS